MSRRLRFISGVGASYANVASHILYSLAIVPIGLHYLGPDQFGLWMLLVQIAGYLTLIELGVFSSAARILIDHKDHKHSEGYYTVVATASAVLFAQGLIMAVACWVLAPFLVHNFGIPPMLQCLAVQILIFLGLSTGLATCFKIYSAILYANQRIDLIWLFVALNPLISLGIIWPLLAAGYGLAALPWSFFPPVIATTFMSWFACRRLGYLPRAVSLTDFRFAKLRELVALGGDFFLINVGTQLLEASQLMIVSRTMGLAAAATWSVSTKLFTLMFQLIAKFENTAIIFFSEMMSRGEHEKLKVSFQRMYQFTGALAICGMLSVVTVNPYFVSLWAGTEVLWSRTSNWLICLLMILNLILRCHTDFVMHTKRAGLLRFLFFFESIAFVAAALWAAPRFGFAGILVVAILCALLFRSFYALHRTASYFAVSRVSVAFRWLAFLSLPGLAMSLIALCTPFLVDSLNSPLTRLLASGSIAAVAASALLCSIGLPADLRRSFHKQLRHAYTNFLTAFRQS